MIRGIDVAKWNGVIDWQRVKNAGVGFAILKVINKKCKTEEAFERNYKGASSVGLPIDVYNYTYATTVEKAISDAKVVVECLKGKNIDRVWLDVEDVCFRTLGNGNIKNIILEYKKVIENAGYRFGVYTGLSFYNQYMRGYNSFFDFPFWIARYPKNSLMYFVANPDESKKPDIVNDLWGWQYTSNGRVDGISGAVDLSNLYGIELIPKQSNTFADGKGIDKFILSKDGEKYISRNFKVKEFRCKDNSQEILIDLDFVKNYLQKIRDNFNAPVTINSAYRTDAYNKKVGGATNSYHKKGQAFDIVVKGKKPAEVALYARSLGINGVIEYNTFVHIDSRENKYWARNDNGKITTIK